MVLLAGDFNARLSGNDTGVQDLPDITIAELSEFLEAPFSYDHNIEHIPRLRG